MVEPGTAAIATLATIAGVSGYGAMKVNKDQDVVIEQKVHERIAQTEERLKQTQEALQAVEAIKSKQDAQLADIQRELDTLRAAKSAHAAHATLQQRKAPERRSLFASRFTPVVPEPGMSQPPQPEPPTVTTDDITFEEPVPEPVVVPPVPEPVVVPPAPAPEPVVVPPAPVPAPEPVVVPPVPEPVPAPAVPTEPDTFPEPRSQTAPEERVAFEPSAPRSLAERLRIAQEQAAKLKEDGLTTKGFLSRLETAKKDAVQEVKDFAESTPLTARVPRALQRPPLPPIRATRRNRNVKELGVPPPIPRRKGGQTLRKKKLRTRRGGKQKKNV